MINKEDIKCIMTFYYAGGPIQHAASTFILTKERLAYLEQFLRHPQAVLHVYISESGQNAVILPFMQGNQRAECCIRIRKSNVMDPLVWTVTPKSASGDMASFTETLLSFDLDWFLRLLDVLTPTDLSTSADDDPYNDPNKTFGSVWSGGIQGISGMLGQAQNIQMQFNMQQSQVQAMKAALFPGNSAAALFGQLPGAAKMPTPIPTVTPPPSNPVPFAGTGLQLSGAPPEEEDETI